jgi:F-type H+-transporting ATPase subunit a
MLFNINLFSTFTTRITRTLTLSFTPFLLLSVANDPIEQYDIGSFTVFNFLFYPVYLHFLVVVVLIAFLTTRIKINAFGYINFKLFNFVRDLFISVFGREKQKLFPFFYYTFLFLLINNLLGMLPWSYTLTAQLTVACFFSITGLGGLILLSVQQKG